MIQLRDACRAAFVQGISGAAGRRTASLMRQYGTAVTAGIVPGRGGQVVDGVPVFDTVAAAREAFPEVTSTVASVAPCGVRDAALEAIAAGCRTIVLRAERVPHHHMMHVVASAQAAGAIVIGANSLGVIAPGTGRLGNLGGEAPLVDELFRAGPVAVISRSGGNTGTLAWHLTSAGVGQSLAVSIGGDAIVGCTLAELLVILEDDEATEAVAYYGEPGTSLEEDAADLLQAGGFTKPLLAHIAGTAVAPGARYGHAGAFVDPHGDASAAAKRARLDSAGAIVVEHFDEIGSAAATALARGADR